MPYRKIIDILWSARWIVLTTLVFSMMGGAYIATTALPRYQATARVVLDYIKPNPVTGAFVSNKMAAAYTQTQMTMIKDYQVAVPAADALGMLDNIEVQSAYSNIPGADPKDFPLWVARQIMATTGVRPVGDSNIIEISSVSSTSDGALQAVTAIREAYIQSTLEAQRAGARGNAAALSARAQQATTELADLEARKAAIEQRTGVIQGADMRRLADMVVSKPTVVIPSTQAVPSAARLAAAEAGLAEVSKTLGPNNPELIARRGAVAGLRAQVAQEMAAMSAGSAAGDSERGKQAMIEAQKSKVLSRRQTLLELQLLQDQIDVRRETLQSLNERIGDLRQLAFVQEAGLTPIGPPEVKPEPVFPNRPLIYAGTGILGFMLGCGLALFIELLNRRAREPKDLVAAVGAPLLGVLPELKSGPSTPRPRRIREPRPPRAPKVKRAKSKAAA